MSSERQQKAWEKVLTILIIDILKVSTRFVAMLVGRTKRFGKRKSTIDNHYELLQRARTVATFLAFLGLFIWFRMIYIVVVINLENGTIQDVIEKSKGSVFIQFIGTGTLFLIGYSLFQLKKRRQFFYGIIEGSFALASGFEFIESFLYSLSLRQMDITYLVPFMSVIYLVVRGLTNISEGFSKLDQVFAETAIEVDDHVSDLEFEGQDFGLIETKFEEPSGEFSVSKNLKIIWRNIKYFFSKDM